jgi:hypothetical protein
VSTAADSAPTTEASVLEQYRDYPTARTGGGTSYVNIADEYVAWLGFANAGMLNRGNLLCFDYALRNLPAGGGAMVEIGAFAGLSTNLLGHYRRKHGVTVPFFNCDRWVFEGADGNVGDSPITHAEYRTYVRDSYLRNVRTFSRGDLPHTIEAFSDEFFKAWGERRATRDVFDRDVVLGGPISFCYIDGDHRYEPSRRDFLNVDRFLSVGGFVLFDDSADGTKFECGRVVEEVKRMPNYRLVVRNPNYLFQKIG